MLCIFQSHPSVSRRLWASDVLSFSSVVLPYTMVAENWNSAGRAFIELWAVRKLLFAIADSRSSSVALTAGEYATLKSAERCPCNIRAHNKGSAHRLRSPFSKRNSSSWIKKRIRRTTYIFKLDVLKTMWAVFACAPVGTKKPGLAMQLPRCSLWFLVLWYTVWCSG